MQSAVKAYGAVAKQTASPRDLEADLLLKAAARLQAIQDSWDSEKASLEDALLFNRKLWSIFLTSVTEADNPLPVEIRQNVSNLAIFILGQTVELMANPTPQRLSALISINRELAAGLRGSA